MDREKLKELIMDSGEIASAVGMQEWVVEKIADHLIANGIGDVAHTSAEVEAKEALKHFESHCHDAISGVFDAYINGIAQGVDEKLNDYKNEAERLRVKLYETEQQLITEKHRADVAEEENNRVNAQLQILHKALGICAREHCKEPTDYVGKAMKKLCCCVCYKVLEELPKIDTLGNRYCKKHYEEHCKQQAEARLKEKKE